MCRSLRYAGLLVPALFVIGCSEKSEGPPTGPEFHTIINTSSGCDVQHTSQLANSFFQPPRQQTVKNLVDLLASETRYSTDAKNTGFDIMAQIEGAVNDGTSGDPAVGSDLINHLLLCMYNPAADKELSSYPETFPENFSVSLTPAAHGAFGARSNASASPVLSRPFSATYTGIAPPEGSTSWGVTNSPARVVLYGRPAPVAPDDQQTYDWRSIPHNANFSPNIILGFCVDQIANPTTMVLEQGVAVLAFANAYFLHPGIGGNCTSSLGLLQGTSPFQLAHRLLRFGTDLLAPRPLMATVLTTGSGGTKSKCCSIVGPEDVPSVDLTVMPKNSDGTPKIQTPLQAKLGRFDITATTKSGSNPVNGVRITLSTSNNNGTPTSVLIADPVKGCTAGKPAVGVTGEDGNSAGTYAFTAAKGRALCITSTGGVFVTVTADVNGRSDQPVSLISNKIKVIP